MVKFGDNKEERKGLIRTTELEPFGRIDIVGQCATEYKESLMKSAGEYNLKYPKYIHWVIGNPRGAGYGYYLVREKR